MGFIGGRPGAWLLERLHPREAGSPDHPGSDSRKTASAREDSPAADLTSIFGKDFLELIRGKSILDYGCGEGREAVEMAARGAERVIGLDIRPGLLSRGRELAARRSVLDRCTFVETTSERVDIVTSKDAFEHFSDPGAVLAHMSTLLKPEGVVVAAFGPIWRHPYGGHMFSVFPWAHLIMTERALIRWRSRLRSDGATRFSEVEGGLNQMTIGRFRRLVSESPLRLQSLECLPIKGIPLFRLPLLREWGTSVVRCRLQP